MTDGTVKKTVVRLQPTKEIQYPNAIEPIKLPPLLREPIHDICSLVNRPDASGVSSEANLFKAGATQPKMSNSG